MSANDDMPQELSSNFIVYTLPRIEEGLDFILTLFEVPKWPRRISTKLTEGRQILVHNKEEALARFKQANYMDC
jgi:hypothetical protein